MRIGLRDVIQIIPLKSNETQAQCFIVRTEFEPCFGSTTLNTIFFCISVVFFFLLPSFLDIEIKIRDTVGNKLFHYMPWQQMM